MPTFNLNDYINVDERIDRFWADYPHGAIRTEMVYANNDGSSVAIRASVYKDWEHPQPDATGIAQELQGGANANKSSWWENCETSAIGRALANMGMSISKQRPSREEMAKVQRYEDDDGHSAAQPARPANAPVASPQPRRDAEAPAPAPETTPPRKVADWPDEELLAVVRDDTRDPVRRVAAAKIYAARATNPLDLNARMLALAALPTADREGIRAGMLARFAPAGVAG